MQDAPRRQPPRLFAYETDVSLRGEGDGVRAYLPLVGLVAAALLCAVALGGLLLLLASFDVGPLQDALHNLARGLGAP